MFLDSFKKKTKIKKKKRKLGHLILQKKENLHITYIMYLMCYLMVFNDLKKKIPATFLKTQQLYSVILVINILKN